MNEVKAVRHGGSFRTAAPPKRWLPSVNFSDCISHETSSNQPQTNKNHNSNTLSNPPNQSNSVTTTSSHHANQVTSPLLPLLQTPKLTPPLPQSPHPNRQRNRTRHRARLQSQQNKRARGRKGRNPSAAAAPHLRRQADGGRQDGRGVQSGGRRDVAFGVGAEGWGVMNDWHDGMMG